MDSEQTKRLRTLLGEAINRNVAPHFEFTMNETVVLSRRLDLLEAAERERQPAPAPAAEQQMTKDGVAVRNGDLVYWRFTYNDEVRTYRVDGLRAYHGDGGWLPLSKCFSTPNYVGVNSTHDPPAQPAPPPADVVSRKEVEELLNGGWDPAQMRARLRRIPSSPAPDVRAEAEMEMWKRCREAVVGVNYIDKLGCTRHGGNVYEDCRAAIDSCKPTAPAGTGGEGGKP